MMKLPFVLLVGALVSVACFKPPRHAFQRRTSWPMDHQIAPLIYHFPYPHDESSPNLGHGYNNDVDNEESNEIPITYWNGHQSEPRRSGWFRPQQATPVLQPEHRRRLFWNSFWNHQPDAHTVNAIDPAFTDPFSLLSSIQQQVNMVLTRPAIRATTISRVVTVTSTVLTPTVATCIPASLFSPASPIACRRKRYDSVEEADSISSNYGRVSPSPTSDQLVIPTARASMENPTLYSKNAKIVSSLDEEDSFWQNGRPGSPEAIRHNRKFLGRDVVTETSTLTMYAFLPTVIRKTIMPVADPSKLLCLPAGAIVCN